MSVPTPGVLAGYTNGTITTFDYTLEFQAIIAQLTAINTNLAALNVNLQTTFGVPGAGVPYTMSNSAAIISNMLVSISEDIEGIKNKSDQTASVIKGLGGSVDMMSQAIHTQVAIQTMAAADQIENNSFQQQATKDALARNNLPNPSPPPIKETIVQKITYAEVIHQEAQLSATVDSMVSNLFTKIESYITTSGPYLYAESALSSMFDKITTGLKSFIQDLLPITPSDVASKAQRELNNSRVPAPKTPGTE
jgi:hypothetical protein